MNDAAMWEDLPALVWADLGCNDPACPTCRPESDAAASLQAPALTVPADTSTQGKT